ncbi:PRAME family member 8-like isoform X1 [Peromyscus californicus insignis]|uniref:PRAME family member 8-like isoform X1 n=1 Tax=Peromyscus californicus insignis TaxID=564181 RepID=UPI0022A76F81|nr:PRAME family member 8-like isoform X1 [Peromyscus californicus insignis]
MSVQTPPTLMKLARQALLRNEALAISALEKLPWTLFPALFKDAFHGRHTRIVKAMVAAWPFPCLPVGTLMKTPNLETFQAVLDGVDMQLTREFHPGIEKLQVLDLRNVQHAFWNIWTGREDGDCSAETVDERPVVKDLPRYALRWRHLKVVTDLYLRLRLNEEQACFLKWAQQRKDFLQIHCMNMKICALPVCPIKEILNVFHPGHIEELELNMGWDVFTLARFAPCLGQMRSLRKLFLAYIYKNTFRIGTRTADREEKCISKVIAQFSKLHCLQHLSMNGIFFIKDHMEQILRSLRTCLETLSIQNCDLSQSDLNYFPWSHSLRQLKHLDLRDITLCTSCLKPLGVLLENVAGTLESLDLQGCSIKDSQVPDFIPALSRCSQLTRVNFWDNDFSMPTLKDLLHHTANWTKMSVEQYPAPMQCYFGLGYISERRFAQLCLELMDTLRPLRQPKRILFSTDPCHECGERCVFDFGPRLCPCWQ